MIELLITCFPVLFRIAYLHYRGRPVTIYAVHRSFFVWFILFFALIFTVEYYHPDTRNALIPFRIVPVVAERGGTVTDVLVKAGQHVEAGDLLFAIDDTREQAALETARTSIQEVRSQIELATTQVKEVQARVTAAEAAMAEAKLTLSNQTLLRDKNSPAFAEDRYLRAKIRYEARLAEVAAARSKVDSLQVQINRVLPAQLDAANAAVKQAEVELSKTRVHSQVSGRIEQLTLNVGARMAQVAINPSMVIVPDRALDDPREIVAGFSQVNRAVIHVGMPVEVACMTNINNAMYNSVLPARIVRIQYAIAPGQLAPSGRLLQPSARPVPGDFIVHARLVYAEQENLLVKGSSCLVQAYTTRIAGSLSGTLLGTIIQAWALEKALIMRMKVWAMLFIGTGIGGGN